MRSLVPPRAAWQQHAACRGLVDLFDAPDRLKRLCQRCPVVVECLETALGDPGLKGVWGGLSDRQRINERQRRTVAAERTA